jgi:hypothetical protein
MVGTDVVEKLKFAYEDAPGGRVACNLRVGIIGRLWTNRVKRHALEMGEQTYNRNLAAEFFVHSSLHRLGLNASLTLGNKKSVDVVVRGEGEALTVDAKGLAGTSSWPGHYSREPKENHFYVFVCYLSQIHTPEVSPEV